MGGAPASIACHAWVGFWEANTRTRFSSQLDHTCRSWVAGLEGASTTHLVLVFLLYKASLHHPPPPPSPQIVGDRYGVGIDDTHVRLRGAPVLDEPALDVHQQVQASCGAVAAWVAEGGSLASRSIMPPASQQT